jgi:putative transposase
MARPLRIEYEGAWYHVLNRGRRKEPIFFCDADRRYFLKLLGEVTQLYALEVHAYSLMPNHYHLLICTPRGNVSRIMRHVNAVYTQFINRKYSFDGALFRGRFKAILAEKDSSYQLELVRYIHRNPFKAKLVHRIGTHPWTSHRAYMRAQERPAWLVVGEVLGFFSRHEAQALKGLDAFVKDAPPPAFEKRLDSMNWPSVLGGEAFKKNVKKRLLGKELESRDVPEYKEFSETMTASELLDLMVQLFRIQKEELQMKRICRYDQIKRAYIYVCRKIFNLKVREIGTALGGINDAVISRQYRRACAEYAGREGCYSAVMRIKKELKRSSQESKT